MLSTKAQEIIADPANELLFSYTSLQELLNKVGRGKLRLTTGTVRDVAARIDALGLTYLPITMEQIKAAAELPHHHSDPSDRVLIVQAQSENVPLLTVDREIRKYFHPDAVELKLIVQPSSATNENARDRSLWRFHH